MDTGRKRDKYASVRVSCPTSHFPFPLSYVMLNADVDVDVVVVAA